MRPPSSTPKPKRLPGQNPKPSPSIAALTPCKNSASASLDLIIFLIVLLSLAFLIASSFSPLFAALTRTLPTLLAPIADSPAPFLAGLLVLLAFTLAAAELSRRYRSRAGLRCEKPGCRGLLKGKEFDVQLQTEDLVRSSPTPVWLEIEGLPWKGGQEGNNPDYECLRAELRRLAPPNGRAVLLFRARCGCPIAKLEGWAPKRSRRHKKAMTSLGMEAGD